MTGRLLHDPIAESVTRFPDRTAVVMAAERLTYAELDRLADHFARALLDRSCQPGDRVCICAPKSPQTVAGMIGALRAGCVYVPIDISGPVSRAAAIIASVMPSCALVGAAGGASFTAMAAAGLAGDEVPMIDLASEPDIGAGRVDLPPAVLPSDPAHILFTSGSTGRPKGVVVTHASARAYVDWAVRHFDIGPGDRCSGHPPLYFDLSTFDVYATLSAGGELHLLPPNLVLPRQFADYILQSQLDQLFCVPSAMTYLALHGAVPAGGFPSLRRILWCGEVLPTSVLVEWMSAHPAASFTNLYGPTEATIASSYHVVDRIPEDAGQPVPIGTACAGEELLLLDEDGAPVYDDQVGELCIAGVGLSPGYWRDPVTTAQVFIPDPRPGKDGGRIYKTGDLARRDDQGTFHFLGRLDSQIKHRGYRIELGEIETAVHTLGAIAECAVVAVSTGGFEGTEICCAFVPSADGGSELAPAHLRAALLQRLPKYMLPTRWRMLDALPKNVNGKIDRREIREQFESALAVR